MAYVSVPKDLTKVKNKVAFNQMCIRDRFEVKDTGVVQHVTMVDEEKPAEKTPEGGKPVSDSPKTGDNTNPVSYTHLDVYKRQPPEQGIKNDEKKGGKRRILKNFKKIELDHCKTGSERFVI